ncbi:tetratricopeptide repeat protein [Limnohabitans sp.]|uniref:tetratricopeptide repeat protein n=1 Tax=Limnohabitans sp. TaxID=1907725 RepID=UPI00286F5C0F|nr:tetratricopeptide repeat protein [Limnohabitans sp.]
MIDVTMENFEADVIAASQTTPVLVDFWADWCGPCKSLGPVLEKLEIAYEGRFQLVKINADTEQQLAGAFGVKSLPTCILLMGGRPVDGFMGALPEGKVRELLDKHLPSVGELTAQAEAHEAETLLQAGDVQAALHKLQEALSLNPSDEEARYNFVKLLISAGHLDEAAAALAPMLAQIPLQLRFDALHYWLQALEFVNIDPRGGWTLAQFDELIAKNKRDFETRLAKARTHIAAGQMEAAMEELLEIIMRDKSWNDGVARKTYVAILELLTPPKPKTDDAAFGKTAGGIELTGKATVPEDPMLEMISRYRRKLSMALN